MKASESIAEVEARLEASLAAALRGAPPIVCFGNDWDGDPTSKHHIMRLYAEHTPVLWVESSGMRRPKLSSPLDARRVIQRLARAWTGVRLVAPRLAVVSPLSIPATTSRAALVLNRLLYRMAVARGLRAIGAREKPLLWVYAPTVAPHLASLPRCGLVYHCVDRWWAFGDYDARMMHEHHTLLCRQADVVFASALELLKDCRSHTDRAQLIPHGVDWRHFARAAHEPLARPADVADIQGPIIGFFGLVHEWVDQSLLHRVARELPHATVVIIGKVQVDVSQLSALANIRFVGQKPYADLPAYAAAFDVALVPFAVNDLTVAVNPIKLREYLAAGVPVVASAIPEIEALADNPMVQTACGPEEFVAAVRAALDAPRSPEARRQAADRVANETWLVRCVEMAEAARARTGWRPAEDLS